MIKIVSGSSVPVGSTVALVSLCNRLNAGGYECGLFGPDQWHLDKCKSGKLAEFRPEKGDVVIVHDIGLHSVQDLQDVTATIEASRSNRWQDVLRRTVRGCFASAKKPDDFTLVLTCQGDGCSARQTNLSLFHKIHCLSDAQQIPRKAKLPVFVCPSLVDDLTKSGSKPAKVAGVVGTIRRENQLELSIKQAFEDGMETAIIYGHLADPIYYYNDVRPVAEQYPGKVKFAGFVDDRQKLYDSVSDVYCSASKPWSTVRLESSLTGTRFHGPDSSGARAVSNDRILGVWVEALGLQRNQGAGGRP
ncbi:MAG: hypothetical protein WCV00_24470 [Verrucomicrobiia bacterium]|jgi:hypothetical protein